jgi:hypothetical protein
MCYNYMLVTVPPSLGGRACRLALHEGLGPPN